MKRKRKIPGKLRAFKISPEQDAKVMKLANELFEGNCSLAIRHMINKYKAK